MWTHFFFFSTQQELHDESISHSYLNKTLSQWIPCVLCFCLEIPKRVIWTYRPWDFLQGIYLNYVWNFSTCLEFLWHVINHVKLINVFFFFFSYLWSLTAKKGHSVEHDDDFYNETFKYKLNRLKSPVSGLCVNLYKRLWQSASGSSP